MSKQVNINNPRDRLRPQVVEGGAAERARIADHHWHVSQLSAHTRRQWRHLLPRSYIHCIAEALEETDGGELVIQKVSKKKVRAAPQTRNEWPREEDTMNRCSFLFPP